MDYLYKKVPTTTRKLKVKEIRDDSFFETLATAFSIVFLLALIYVLTKII